MGLGQDWQAEPSGASLMWPTRSKRGVRHDGTAQCWLVGDSDAAFAWAEASPGAQVEPIEFAKRYQACVVLGTNISPLELSNLDVITGYKGQDQKERFPVNSKVPGRR